MRRRRKLTPEERELWAHVAASAVALRPARAAAPFSPEPAAPPKPQPGPQPAPQPPPRPALPDFRIGQRAAAPAFRHDPAPALPDWLAQAPVQMDRKAHQKMTRGRITPEARLDLHGMTLAEAHPELIRFVLGAQAAGRRLVLVITGKGRLVADDGPIPLRRGLLRHQVPQWLHQPPLAGAVIQVAQAHLKHGGAGAYYVYLRRAR
jgi:DNA-nicking Smr family endonuclease